MIGRRSATTWARDPAQGNRPTRLEELGRNLLIAEHEALEKFDRELDVTRKVSGTVALENERLRAENKTLRTEIENFLEWRESILVSFVKMKAEAKADKETIEQLTAKVASLTQCVDAVGGGQTGTDL